MINKLYKHLTRAIGMKTTCCNSDQYSVIEKSPVCTNTSCEHYLAPTGLRNIFTISYHTPSIKAG